jgi:Cu/Ag efflux protein CusF
MNLIKSAALGLGITFGLTFGAFAQEVYTKGVVKKVKPEDSKVTIIHEELVNLEMPAMTMVFVVSDPAMIEKMTPGAEIEFVADRVDGKLTVVKLK